jgi:hypothetical protein
MNLGGILAAGAAQGAANASNMNVQAQNVLEIDQNREALREEYLNRRFDKELAVGRENAKAAGALRDMEYNRKRADIVSDTEAKHKQAVEIEGYKDKRSAANNATRLQAASIRGKSSGGDGDSTGKGVTLPNGEVFVPNDADSKAAANYLKLGLVNTIQEGYQRVHALRLSGQAANSIEGLGKTTAEAAMTLSGELLGKQQQPKVDRYKLEDLIK